MKEKGITFVEILVIISIIALLIIIGFNPNHNQITFGVNGITETRCINGYQFTVGDGGQARQILDEFGRGIKCKN
jgi:hypothetical protein